MSGSFTHSPDESILARLGGFAGLGIAITMVVAYGLYFTLSSVGYPRSDAAAYLDDIAGKRDTLALVGWLLGLHALLIVPWVVGLYSRLRASNETVARFVLGFGLSLPIWEVLYVAPVVAITMQVVPQWTSGGTPQATLLSEFQILQWLSDIFTAAFDATLVIFQILLAVLMLRTRTSFWPAVGWVTLVSAAANLIGIFWLAEDALYLVGGIGLVLGWLFVLGSSLLLLNGRPAGRLAAAPA
jgi:hypothetical protein